MSRGFIVTEYLAFTVDQARRLTGLTERQLRYWDNLGFFSPEYADKERHHAYSRLYSFRDVVGLRTIAILIDDYRVPTGQLRAVGAWLHQYHETPWSSLRFYVGGGRVHFDDPETEARMSTNPQGQLVFPIEMDAIAASVRNNIENVRARPAEKIGRIERTRNVVHNAPVIAGTRVTTEAIWSFHEAGYATSGILQEYPQLQDEDVRAAIDYERHRRQTQAG